MSLCCLPRVKKHYSKKLDKLKRQRNNLQNRARYFALIALSTRNGEMIDAIRDCEANIKQL